VQVEANAEQVETRSGTLAQTVEQHKIIELPLNGRNAATLILLTPGTADLNAGNARGAGDTSDRAPRTSRLENGEGDPIRLPRGTRPYPEPIGP
jgi:hypothetical protein